MGKVRICRFMSGKEYQEFCEGKTLVNNIEHNTHARSTSKGFCFLPEEVSFTTEWEKDPLSGEEISELDNLRKKAKGFPSLFALEQRANLRDDFAAEGFYSALTEDYYASMERLAELEAKEGSDPEAVVEEVTLSARECLLFLGGIVTEEYFCTFEVEKGPLEKTEGIYADPYRDWDYCARIGIMEYSISEYSSATFRLVSSERLQGRG